MFVLFVLAHPQRSILLIFMLPTILLFHRLVVRNLISSPWSAWALSLAASDPLPSSRGHHSSPQALRNSAVLMLSRHTRSSIRRRRSRRFWIRHATPPPPWPQHSEPPTPSPMVQLTSPSAAVATAACSYTPCEFHCHSPDLTLCTKEPGITIIARPTAQVGLMACALNASQTSSEATTSARHES